ncbi:MAG TPA: DegV family protein [Syntrophomonadaceae bacterium]|nr:DegV family protein [Syntrophomonadaceae bacterium]
MGIRVLTDSTSYIDAETQKESDIIVIPLSVHFPDESFLETEVDQSYFYNKIERTGIIPTSSQPSQGQIYEIFREIVSAGDDILAIFISAAMSGTYATALSVKDQLLREFAGAVIEVLDSHTNCMALGLQVIAAARVVQGGGSMKAAMDAAQRVQDTVHFYFVPDTLEYLKKGGRIGTASCLLGSILNIRPILTVDMSKGMTHLLEKARGASNALKRIMTFIDQDYVKFGLNVLVVHHINAPEKANRLKQTLSDLYHLPITVCSIGPVIGLHTGLGTVGVVYCTGSVEL